MNTSQISRSSNRLHALTTTTSTTGIDPPAQSQAQQTPSAGVGAQWCDLCADCGSADAQWAVLNRGVLVCTECCSVHRALGRHVSQVRSLRAAPWHRSELDLVLALSAGGANNVWEHALLVDACAPNAAAAKALDRLPRKPNARDPINPVKADFIRAKYANLAFCWRPAKDDEPHLLSDVNRQLWCCARTGHITTSLRLLALGADANCADDCGVTAVHVAARENQPLQVELLYIYGADVAAVDAEGRRPADVALAQGHQELARRLVELQYDLTDRLSRYLCGKAAEHFDSAAAADRPPYLVPEMAALGNDGSLADAIARRRLRLLPAEAFERLAQDLFDEMERRETDAAWLAAMTPQQLFAFNHRYIVPFLPANGSLSATRNQCRQKLATLSARRFARALVDLLAEARRRWLAAVRGPSAAEERDEDGTLPEKEPLAVANENDAGRRPFPKGGQTATGADRSPATPDGKAAGLQNSTTANAKPEEDESDAADYDLVAASSAAGGRLGSGASSKSTGGGKSPRTPAAENDTNGAVGGERRTDDELLELRDRLDETGAAVQAVQRRNEEIVKQLHSLSAGVDAVRDDAVQLRVQQAALLRALRQPRPLDQRPAAGAGGGVDSAQSSPPLAQSSPSQRHHHKERHNQTTTEAHKNYVNVLIEKPASAEPPVTNEVHETRAANASAVDLSPPTKRDHGRKAKSVDKLDQVSPAGVSGGRPSVPACMSASTAVSRPSAETPAAAAPADGNDADDLCYPDDVIVLTEQLTGVIQRLLSDAHRGARQRFPLYADEMRLIADRMRRTVPSSPPALQRCMDEMSDACVDLVVRCGRAARGAHAPVDGKQPAGVDADAAALQPAVQSAYTVAKIAKRLLALVQMDVTD